MTGGVLAGERFVAYAPSVGPVIAAVRRHAPSAIRVLEVGCGSGQLIVELAGILAEAEFTGTELSQANVELAREIIAEHALSERARIIPADYVTMTSPGRFDLIVAQSVLHLIDHADDELWNRVVADLGDGGLLIATLPRQCLYNRVLYRIRETLALIRRPALDRLMLATAAVLYRRVPASTLRDRLPYMYLPAPRREDGLAMRQAMASVSLDVLHEVDIPPMGIAQPRHRLVVVGRRPRSAA